MISFGRYERFLKIMILSVLKNTNRPVKFWFIKNYLSPQFKVVRLKLLYSLYFLCSFFYFWVVLVICFLQRINNEIANTVALF